MGRPAETPSCTRGTAPRASGRRCARRPAAVMVAVALGVAVLLVAPAAL